MLAEYSEKFVLLDEIHNAETDKAALATKINVLEGLFVVLIFVSYSVISC